MFIEFIHSFIETLTNTTTADIFSAPFALFVALLLISFIFMIFCDGKTKRIVFISILILTLVYCVYSLTSTFGFVMLPITLGG